MVHICLSQHKDVLNTAHTHTRAHTYTRAHTFTLYVEPPLPIRKAWFSLPCSRSVFLSFFPFSGYKIIQGGCRAWDVDTPAQRASWPAVCVQLQPPSLRWDLVNSLAAIETNARKHCAQSLSQETIKSTGAHTGAHTHTNTHVRTHRLLDSVGTTAPPGKHRSLTLR